MAETILASQTLQKFTELEELAEEILDDKHQVKILTYIPSMKIFIESIFCIWSYFLDIIFLMVTSIDH